jgi:nitroreductase
MEVEKAIKERRSYRSLGEMEVTPQLINELARAASLAPSCFNNQPWRYVFVYGDKLTELHSALASANEWANKAPLLVAIFSKAEYDCIINDREYYSFDVGLSVQSMILKATDMGLVTHLMAGYDPAAVQEILNIPEDMKVISLLAVGKQVDEIDPDLSAEQKEAERERPERLELEEFVYHNNYE